MVKIYYKEIHQSDTNRCFYLAYGETFNQMKRIIIYHLRSRFITRQYINLTLEQVLLFSPRWNLHSNVKIYHLSFTVKIYYKTIHQYIKPSLKWKDLLFIINGQDLLQGNTSIWHKQVLSFSPRWDPHSNVKIYYLYLTVKTFYKAIHQSDSSAGAFI